MSEAYSYDADELLEAADIDASDERDPYDPGMPEDGDGRTGGAADLDDFGDFEDGLQGAAEHPVLPDMSSFDNGAPTDQPVPRIAIQAFCERPETAKLIQRSAGDRRLAKAQVTVNMGGLPTAIETFHDKSTPHLIIVESGMQGQGLFSQLDELASVCDPETNVIVIGAANDISLYRELMRKLWHAWLVGLPVGNYVEHVCSSELAALAQARLVPFRFRLEAMHVLTATRLTTKLGVPSLQLYRSLEFR